MSKAQFGVRTQQNLESASSHFVANWRRSYFFLCEVREEEDSRLNFK